MNDFIHALDLTLRLMDEEAVPSTRGPTGLAWYGAHYEPEKKRPRTECCWSLQIAESLSEFDFPTEAEVAYPGQRRRKVDDLITLKDGSKLWLENKGAWKEYWRLKSSHIYRSYLLHPLVAGLEAKSHTAALDLEKLSRLRGPEAQHVALLIVGFDTMAHKMDRDIDEFSRLAALDEKPWKVAHANWPDRDRDGNRVCYWLWHRSVMT